MVVIDRVVCDFCFCVVGQMFSVHADIRNGLPESIPPYFAVCPDCHPLSVQPLETVPKQITSAGVISV